jgi:hypothetical protein
MIVVGRISKVHSCEHPRGVPGVGTVATATIDAKRYLKGHTDAKGVEIDFQCEAFLDLGPDAEDVIWFIGEKTEGGRYAVRSWKWGTSSLPFIESVLRLIDRTTRTPGMPEVDRGKKPISLGLVTTDGDGKGTTSVKVASVCDLSLLVQFENHEAGARAVMPFLYGSDLRWRYPRYELEIVGEDGVRLSHGKHAVCKCIAPLDKWDIVSLKKGEVFRTPVPVQGYALPEGKYRVRVVYTAKQDAAIADLPTRELDADVSAALKTVWEGVESNWIDVEVSWNQRNAKP